jgi:hypothetical protein
VSLSVEHEELKRNEIHLNGLGIKLQTLLLVGEELLNIFALITLKLNHLSHLTVDNDGAIASWWRISRCQRGRGNMGPTELLLDDLEDLLLIELLWQTLDSRQSLTTISL